MYDLRINPTKASELAQYLNLELHGDDPEIKRPALANVALEHCLAYAESLGDAEIFLKKNPRESLLLVPGPLPTSDACSFIVSDNPRRDFVVLLHEFFLHQMAGYISSKANISADAHIEESAYIGDNVSIGKRVTIGKGSYIMNNVVINNDVTIGRNCVIKNNAVIGSHGYAFVIDSCNKPLHIPQLGSVIIGNRVWIGANTTIEKYEMENTIIDDDVKIDDLVHIGGGCIIKEKCMITAGAVLGRSVTVSRGCVIAPNATIRGGASIGDNTIIGLGSVLIASADENSVYVGNPAKFLRRKLEEDNE